MTKPICTNFYEAALFQYTNLNIGYSGTQITGPVDKTFTSVNCSAVK